VVEDYPVHLFLSQHGYFKKITPQSLRMSGEQKYKEDDGLSQYFETTNRAELLLFTDKQQVYKLRISEVKETKASALGDFLPGTLGMDEGESIHTAILAGDYTGTLLLFFQNGKCARLTLDVYATKTNRRRLTGAYSDKSPLVAVMLLKEDTEVAVTSGEGRCVVFNTALMAPKTSRTTQGVQVMNLKKHPVTQVCLAADSPIQNLARYRVRNIPAAGAKLTEEDRGEKQLSLLD
jgi:DNA gyrase subunit A